MYTYAYIGLLFSICSLTQLSSIGAESENGCEHGTYELDLENCAGFYQCANGVLYHHLCPNGLHWNSDRKACDYSDIIKCESGIEDKCEHNSYLPDSKNCSEFYQCVNGKLQHKFCPDKLHWNGKRKSCDYSENAECDLLNKTPHCKNGAMYGDHGNLTKYYHCINGQIIQKECDFPFIWDDTSKVCSFSASEKIATTFGAESVSECKHDSFKPDFEDCAGFYQCSHGIFYHHLCPDRLHWNHDKKECDYPEVVGCGILKVTPFCENGSLYGDLLIPTKYYHCINGELIQKECPFPLVWMDKWKACTVSKLGKIDSDLCEEGSYYPDYENCERYYHCVHGKFKHLRCSNGLHWNEKKNKCDHPDSAECGEDGDDLKREHTFTKAKIGRELGRCVHGSHHPDYENCARFYQCSYGDLKHLWCPAGLHWNDEVKNCDYPASAKCVCEHESYRPDYRFCGGYYHCVHGKFHHHLCPFGLHWNKDKKECDYPAVAKCEPLQPHPL